MIHCKAAAVLDTMWGFDGKAPAWFRINDFNHSGRRLYNLLGHKDLWVTNACREQVSHAKLHGVPDSEWLAKNLQRIQYDLLLVCGKIAQRAYTECMYKPNCVVLLMPHPAARMWSKAMIDYWQEKIKKSKAMGHGN